MKGLARMAIWLYRRIIALYPRARVLRTLAFVPMRQQHHYAGEQLPFIFALRDELVYDDRRSATGETLYEVEAIAIAGSDMRRLMRQHGDIAVKLVIGVARRLREANERLTRQSFQTVQSRVAGVLLQLVEQARGEGAGARDVLLKVTQAEIAQLAGSSRESASRFLANLERAGVITQGRGRITVHDPEALKRYIF